MIFVTQDCCVCLSAISQGEQSQSAADSDGLNNETSSENMLAEAFEQVDSTQPSKTQRLTNGLQILFSPHGRFVVSTLQGIQEEQQRLSYAIAALRVNSCLFPTLYFIIIITQLVTRHMSA